MSKYSKRILITMIIACLAAGGVSISPAVSSAILNFIVPDAQATTMIPAPSDTASVGDWKPLYPLSRGHKCAVCHGYDIRGRFSSPIAGGV